MKTKVRFENNSLGGLEMKRLIVLILVWTLLVVTGTLVSANGQALDTRSNNVIKARAGASQFAMTITEAN